jgi:hypothetical protein
MDSVELDNTRLPRPNHAQAASEKCRHHGAADCRSYFQSLSVRVQRSLKRLFELGGVPDAHAHRFRDTFFR